MSVIHIPRKPRMPTGRVQLDHSNPFANGLLLAATPFSQMSAFPEISYGVKGAAARGGGVLSGPAVTHGLGNSSVFVMTQALAPDDGAWWSGTGSIYGDTASGWPNDLGLILKPPQTYGRVNIAARNTAGTVITAAIDVLEGSQVIGGVFTGGATIDGDLLVTGYGSGQSWGTSAAFQGFSYNSPNVTLLGPMFGQPVGGSGAMDFVSRVYRWGRVLAAEEMFEIEREPDQIWRSDPVRIYSFPSGPISISWSSLTASGITPTTATLTLGGITR